MCQFKWICAKCVPLKIDRKKQKKLGAGKAGGDPTMEPAAACIVANLP